MEDLAQAYQEERMYKGLQLYIQMCEEGKRSKGQTMIDMFMVLYFYYCTENDEFREFLFGSR